MYGPFISGDRVEHLSFILGCNTAPSAPQPVQLRLREFSNLFPVTAANFVANGRSLVLNGVNSSSPFFCPNPSLNFPVVIPSVPLNWVCDGKFRYLGIELSNAGDVDITGSLWAMICLVETYGREVSGD
jgi:hypothetical protein